VRADQGERALIDHCVPLDEQLWKVESFRDFLAYRRMALAKAINQFINGDMESESIDVEGLIAGGESELVEFKETARWDTREHRVNKVLEQVIAKTIAAFLNSRGGTLLIGVDDTGSIRGVEPDYATLGKRPDCDGYEQFLVQLVSSTLGKNVCADLSISFYDIQGKEICVVHASASASPVYINDQGQSKLFARLGNTSQELTGKHAVEYVQSRWPRK
jgi:predicted HTH transcriptional regulator